MSKIIGIVVAMERETGVLKKFKTKRFDYMGVKFYSFKTHGNRVILAECGIGETRAASATTLLISRFGAQEIINYGYVGALDNTYPINSVYAVKQIVHTDVDLTAFGQAPAQYDGRDKVEFDADLTLTSKICPDIDLKRLASSDKFVSSGTAKQALRTTYKCDICDMEGAGVASVCERANVPFAMLKIVADGVEDDCTDSFNHNSMLGIEPLVDTICRYLKKTRT